MAKCDLCGAKIQTTFLGKLLGTTVKNDKGKKKYVCQNCQKTNSMSDIKAKL